MDESEDEDFSSLELIKIRFKEVGFILIIFDYFLIICFNAQNLFFFLYL